MTKNVARRGTDTPLSQPSQIDWEAAAMRGQSVRSFLELDPDTKDWWRQKARQRLQEKGGSQ